LIANGEIAFEKGKKMRSAAQHRLALFFGLVLIALAIPSLTVAQGCALCYQSAAAASARAIHALRDGIVILIVPPFCICTAISYLVYRRRNSHDANS
jgi:hypothetical protein